MADFRTPLARVRGLGSAREGTGHFWRQRLTSVAAIPLTAFLVAAAIMAAGSDYETARAMLASPWVALPMLLTVLVFCVHMRLGMQVIIEDYVHGEGAKVICLMLNTFFVVAVGLACVYAIMKLGFGA